MKKVKITNIVLGIIAAEVVFQAVQAMADRPMVAGKSFPPVEPPRPRKDAERFLIGNALRFAGNLLRSLLFGAKAGIPQDTGHVPERKNFPAPGKPDPAAQGMQKDAIDEAEEEGLHLKGSMEGIAAKLKDPAWAGVLAANDGNISLTDAERAVPMPNSAKFVERLDKNPFVGKGMKDHSRDHT